MDEQYKEERRKEKRRIQDQLRRLKRNELKAKTTTPKPEKKPPPIKPSLLKMRCSACHGTGHMKTNKHCPLYNKDTSGTPTKDGITDDEASMNSTEVAVVEGTKIKISKKFLLKSVEEKNKKPVK